MGKHLIICGHGQGKSGYDPGAVGNYGTEAEWVRKLANAMKQYSTDIDYIIDKNVYDYRDIANYKGYASVTELHLNAFNKSAYGCEVLVHSNFTADNLDYALLNVLKQYFYNRGIKKRNNIYNMNVSARVGINYRLVEVCFVDNDNDMKILSDNLDAIAHGFVQAISGKVKEKTPMIQNIPGKEIITHGAYRLDITDDGNIDIVEVATGRRWRLQYQAMQ